MQLAFTILVMALNLISSVNQSPNATPELRNQATQIASYAISYAQTVLSQEENSKSLDTGSPVELPKLETPKSEVVIQLGSTLLSSSTVVNVTKPVLTEKTDSLVFIKQPIPSPLILINGKYRYNGRQDGTYETNNYFYNVKENCFSQDNVAYDISSFTLEPGQTYTCTLTAESKSYWNGNWDSLLPSEVGTSDPYSFTVPLN